VTGVLDETTSAALAALTASPPETGERLSVVARPRRRPPGRPVSRHMFYQLADCYLGFFEELWGRSWNIASQSLRQLVHEASRSGVRPRGADHLLRNLLDQYTNYVSGMVMALPLAAEWTAARASDTTRSPRPEQDFALGEAAPRTIGIMHELYGTSADAGSTPFVTPARITDASQGWAMYVVPCKIAEEVLGKNADFVAPFDLGGGRTLLAVLGVDYRVTDFGQYREIALALAVTARSDPAGIPGVIFLGIAVTGEFSREVARDVWGLQKILCKDLAVAYRPDRVNFGLSSDHGQGLSITFPRFGGGSFDRIPMLIYSRQDSGDQRAAAPMQSVLSLSGQGEGVQIGGSVSIHVGSANRAGCICRGSLADCLCRMLEAFDVKDRLPVANGWTEHLSGTFHEPRVLDLSH
jgi:hypothetical protein